MTYGHALALLSSCALSPCPRHASVTTDDGRLLCARHALEETRMPHPATAATIRLTAAVGETRAAMALLRAATENPDGITSLTGPWVVRKLSSKAGAIRDFAPDRKGDDWTINLAPQTLADGRWVVEFDRATLHVPDLADVQLARTIVDARTELGQGLRRQVMGIVTELGLPNRRQFLRPAR